MGLKYICSGSTYDISGPEHEPVSNKKHRLNYVVSGSTKQIGLATNSSCTQYSPLRIKTQTTIDGNNVTAFYIGRSESASASEKLTYTSATLGYQWTETFTQSSYTYTNGNKSTTGTTYQTRSSTSRYDYRIKVTVASSLITSSMTTSFSKIYKRFSTKETASQYMTTRSSKSSKTNSVINNNTTTTIFIKNDALTATDPTALDFICTIPIGTTSTKTSTLHFISSWHVTESYASTYHPSYNETFSYSTNNTTSSLDAYYTNYSVTTNFTHSDTYDTTASVITTYGSKSTRVANGISYTTSWKYYNWNFETGSRSQSRTHIELIHYSTGGNVTSANASQTTSSDIYKTYTCSSTSNTVYGTQYITYTQNSYTYTQDGAYWEASATFTNTSQARTTSFTNGYHGSATASYVNTTSYTVSSSSSQSTHNFV